MGNPAIPKIDYHDDVIGETTKEEAIKNDWPRRISRVFVFDETGTHTLLQKRSENVLFPGLWDQAVGGHVDVGETYQEAAAREMKEELGVDGVLREIITSYWTGADTVPGTFNGIYVATIPMTTKIEFDPEEVSEARWFSGEEFEALITEHPEACVAGFLEIWKSFRAVISYQNYRHQLDSQ